MQTLRANQQSITYALFSAYTDTVDSQGRKTGEKTKTYATPVTIRAYISSEAGTDSQKPFGITSPYTHTMITDNMSCPIKEDTIIWIGTTPNQGLTNYTHIVRRISRGLNTISYLLQEVDVQ